MAKLDLPRGKQPLKKPSADTEMSMTEYHEWILHLVNHFFTAEELRRLQDESRWLPGSRQFQLKALE